MKNIRFNAKINLALFLIIIACSFPCFDSFDIYKKIRFYSNKLGKFFHKLSGYAYCSHDQMKNNKCCPSLFKKKEILKRVFSKQYKDEHNYTFAILLSEKNKKIVITFTGTKETKQLYKEATKSGGKVFLDSQKYSIYKQT